MELMELILKVLNLIDGHLYHPVFEMKQPHENFDIFIITFQLVY